MTLPDHILPFIAEVVVFIGTFILFLTTKNTTRLPTNTGNVFIKDDITLSYPVNEHTVPAWIMSLSSHVSPVFLIVILCILRSIQEDGFNTGLASPVASRTITSRRIRFHPAILAALSYTMYFFYAAALMAVIEVVLRHMVGEFQPNFLAICKPNYNGSSALFYNIDVCTGDKEAIYKACWSFPSQWAAHMSFGFVFNACIVYCVPQFKNTQMLKTFIIAAMLMLPILGGLSAYTDRINHWYDVVAGLLLGSSCALYVVMFPLRLFGILSSESEITGPVPAVTFDQLATLPYSDFQSENELNAI